MDAYIGTIGLFPYQFVPQYWYPCDGRLLKLAGYSALFSLIGTYYGGDGKVTFALPNLVGSQPVQMAPGGQGAGSGRTPRTLGTAVGTASHTLTLSEMPPHGHTLALYQGAASPTANPLAGSILLDPQTNGFLPPVTLPSTSMNVSTILPAGGNQPHPNDQPWLALVHCICWSGIYPAF